MSQTHERAREDFRHWKELQPGNFFTENHQLQRLARHGLGEDLPNHQAHFVAFGEVAANELDQAADINNRPWNLPRLERWSAIGERTEEIEHHPSYETCGTAIYDKGRLIASYDTVPGNFLAQILFFLSSHAGEAGHNQQLSSQFERPAMSELTCHYANQ